MNVESVKFIQQAGKVETALKSGFLKTDADLLLDEGMAECLKIRKEVARRFVCEWCAVVSLYVKLLCCHLASQRSSAVIRRKSVYLEDFLCRECVYLSVSCQRHVRQ
jgi:hypothetical protein